MDSQSDEDKIRAEAHAWRTVMDDDPSASERSAFEAWLEQDPRHGKAFDQAAKVWTLLAHVETAARRPAYVTGAAWMSAAATLLLAVILANNYLTTEDVGDPTFVAQFSTGPAQIETIELDDGSFVTLGGSTELRFNATSTARRATLVRGDAFFDVRHDVDVPFIVNAYPADIRVTGTSFSVSQRGSRTSVGVSTGSVWVRPQKRSVSEQAAIELTPGFQISVDRRGLDSPQRVDVEQIGAWRTGRLVFRAAPLLQVVNVLNRYDERQISLGYVSVANEPVTATIQTNDIDSGLQMLMEAYALALDYEPNGDVRVLERD